MLTRLDWIVIGSYLVTVVAIGIASRGKQSSSHEYFIPKGAFGGVLGSIIVGLSIAASYFSGISFLAYPGIVYANGLPVLVGLLPFAVAGFVLRFYFLPRYLALNPSRPYDVVEQRFGRGVRTMAGWLFILARIAWMGTLIYAPTMAIMAAAKLDPHWFWPIVLIVGLSGTLYTVLGGLRGVIIVDAMQMLVIIGSLFVLVGFVLMHMPLSLGEAVHQMGATGKLNWFKPSFDFTKPFTFWAVICGMSIGDIANYVGDQMSLQRYLTQRTTEATMRSFIVNLIGTITTILLLASVGLLLAIWYGLKPNKDLPAGADRVLPYFVARELPAGVAGLLLAAILAATINSMTSGVNALAASVMMDFHLPLLKRLTQKQELLFAKATSLLIGITATLAAGLVAQLGQLFDIIQRLLGTFLAPLGLLLILSVLKRRLRPRMVMLGIIAGCCAGGCVAITAVLKRFYPWIPAIDSLWVGPASWLAMLLVSFSGGLRKPVSTEVKLSWPVLVSDNPEEVAGV